MKIVKSLTRSMMFAMAMLPLLAKADVVVPELSHIETTTYVHRLHRIGYELLKDECDSLGAVDCVAALEYGKTSVAPSELNLTVDSPAVQNYGMALWMVVVAILVGLVLVFRNAIGRLFAGLGRKWAFLCGWRGAGLFCAIAYVVVCCLYAARQTGWDGVLWWMEHWIEVVERHCPKWKLVEEHSPDWGLQIHSWKDSIEGVEIKRTEHVEEMGWCYSDQVPERWMVSCVSAVERIRKPLKRHMHVAPDSWNNTQTSEVIEALKSAPALLKESKGIAIEVLVAAVRAADKDMDYLKNIGKEVRSERIIDRKRHNPNYGRCSKCGREGYMPTHRCDDGNTYSDRPQ